MKRRRGPPAENTNCAAAYAPPALPVLLVGDACSGLAVLAKTLQRQDGVACLTRAFVADPEIRKTEVRDLLPDPPGMPLRAALRSDSVWSLPHVWRRIALEGAGRYRIVVVPATFVDLDARARGDDLGEVFGDRFVTVVLLRNPLSCYADELAGRLSWERAPVPAEALDRVRLHEAWKRRLDELPGRVLVFSGPLPVEVAEFFGQIGVPEAPVRKALAGFLGTPRSPAARLGASFVAALPADARRYASSVEVT